MRVPMHSTKFFATLKLAKRLQFRMILLKSSSSNGRKPSNTYLDTSWIKEKWVLRSLYVQKTFS